MRRKPSLRDVALAAGVHVSTVSRALNRETAKLLSPAVAERIQAVAAEMGYYPNAMAAGLRKARSGGIGFVVPDLTHPAFPHMLRGIEAVLGPAGYVPLVVSVEHDFSRAPALLREMRGRQVEGMIVATAQVDDPFIAAALADGLPMISINAADPEGRRFSAVIADEEAGVAAVMAHLRALGHRRVAHLAGPAPTRTGQGRTAAFLANGGRVEWIEPADSYDRPGAHAACRRLLDRYPPGRAEGLTAIVAANDLLALGCLDILAERGLNCPADISLTGVMDLPNMDLIAPPLTTIAVDPQAMGEHAARMLVARIVERELPVETLTLPTRLVPRASCRAV